MAWHGMVVVIDGVMWQVVWHGIVMLVEVSIKRNGPTRKTRMQSRRAEFRGMKLDGKEWFGFCDGVAGRQWARQLFVLVAVAIAIAMAGFCGLWLLVWLAAPTPFFSPFLPWS